MQLTRILSVGILAASFAAAASAQFDGPAPLAWRFVQPTSVPPGGAPLVDGNTVYQSIGGRVFAIEKDTGNMMWRFPQLDPIDGAFRTSPLLVNGVLVAAGDNKLVYGVNPANGELKWSYPLTSAVLGQPILVGSAVIFATSDNKLNAIAPDTGKPIWDRPYNVFDGISGALGSFGDNVLFFTSRNDLASLNVTTQKLSWSKPIRFTQLPPSPVPVVDGDTIYSVSGPFLIAVNANNGVARWQVNTGMQIIQPATVSKEAIYVISQDGKVMGYNHDRDKLTKNPVDLGTLAIARPTAVGKYLLVPTTAGGVALVDPDKGKVVWNYLIRPLVQGQSGSAPGPGSGTGSAPGSQGSSSGTQDKPLTVQPSGPIAVAGNTVLVPARDGSLLAFDDEVGVDLTPPTVKMVFPNPGDQVSGQPPLLLAFKLNDEASGIDLSTVKVDIEGQDYEYSFNKEGFMLVRFSLTGNNRPLGDGRKTITVTAVDWMGNVAKQQFALTIDNTLKPIVLPGSETTNNPGGLGGGGGGKGGGGGGGFGGG